MIRRNAVKSLMESKGGAKKFVPWLHHALGLADANGNRYTDSAGNQILKDPAGGQRLNPREFSLAHLGRGMLGDELFEDQFAPDSRKLAGYHSLMEAGEGALGASGFANTNAFTAAVAGLMEVGVLEKYRAPEFITESLFPAVPSKMFEGKKMVGTQNIGDRAEQREPGMPTARVRFGERWIQQPRTVENALSVEVLQEAVYLDLTGQVLEEAGNLGTWLAYRKEIRGINAFLGITSSYNYNGTSYATYISGGYYDNRIASGNPLTHWNNIQNAWVKMQLATDPDTSIFAGFAPDTIVTVPQLFMTAQAIVGADRVQFRDASTAAQNIREFSNPIKGVGVSNVVSSPLIYQQAIAANGLNLSTSNGASLWFALASGKFGQYAQNWPLRTQQATPGQKDMIDRGSVFFMKADERGEFWVTQPRACVYNQQ